MIQDLSSTNLKAWIDQNRQFFNPPFRTARVLAHHSEFVAMIVHGPNERLDFHREAGEEFFFQVYGEIELHLKPEDQSRQVVTIGEGEVFLCPAGLAHSPRRGAGTWGLVVERKRHAHEREEFLWFCENCDQNVLSRVLPAEDVTAQVSEIYKAFNADATMRTCKSCGYVFPLVPVAERLAFL
jgi:3-hydroxyanthranilate 3,4-dioxygenase